MSLNSDNSSVECGDSECMEKASSSKSSTAEQSASSVEDKRFRLVHRESQYVFYLRLVVVLVLFLAASGVSLLIYLITNRGEKGSFESSYDAAAEKVLGAFMEIANEKMGAAGSLVVTIVAHGMSLDDSWPFVTLSSFQERASTIKKLSGALYIGINPVVTPENREKWEWYSTQSEDSKWYQEGRIYQQSLGIDNLDNREQVETDDPRLNLTSGVANHIYDFSRKTGAKAVISPMESDFYLPVWQTSPITKRSMVNQNRASNSNASIASVRDKEVVFEGMQYSTPGFGDDPNPVTAEIAWLLRMANRHPTKYEGDIFSTVFFPIFDNFKENRKAVGVMRIMIHWARFFQNILPDSAQGLIVVLENGCDQPYTYQIDGPDVRPLGHGDQHDTEFDEYEKHASFADVHTISDGTAIGLKLHQSECPYSIRVYPSKTFEREFESSAPFLVTFAVACVFIFAVFVFFMYDYLVGRRQAILMRKAQQTHEIVASLFPKNVRDQLLQDDRDSGKDNRFAAPNQRLKSFLADGNDSRNQAPIADLYPHATVLFADISGFTAWSSSRDPAQVFILLQRVYQAFDDIARRRKVFKVETIGDSYVAVTGLPEPQPRHAVIMARFAQECIVKMTEVVRDLETTLGPDTAELMMRFGLNSGPVTAGVLRGERSRFQLFGDTVNTAARMESTGMRGKIHCSQSTAELLSQARKEHWLKPRQDAIHAKGKGVLKTYWIMPYAGKAASTQSTESRISERPLMLRQDALKGERVLKHERLVGWMVEILQDHIRHIVAHHQAARTPANLCALPRHAEGHVPLDEVVEAITLPDFDASTAHADASSVQIPEHLVENLREYVAIIASSYRENPFHNFEHACHVTMSVSKFLKRIVTPEIELKEIESIQDKDKVVKQIASHLHDYTHGLTSDPITIFAVVFSGFIHDADHRGVSNVQLMKEEPAMASIFKNKSVAEQNSLEIAWQLFMSDRFNALRNYIFADNQELLRFRQVIVNAVLATDIMDKELNDLRRTRWEKAFSEDDIVTKESHALRATIVVEHIIQASDVSHTMQHWHIYRKWNQRLFTELMAAYKAGRMGSDPASFWYKGELSFFDNYIIPLAKKLKECNVFGVSSDECLNYAVRNREEWEQRGEGIVEEMVAEFSGVA